MSLTHVPVDVVDIFLEDPHALLAVLYLERCDYDCWWQPQRRLVEVFDRLKIHGMVRRKVYKKLRKSGLLLTSRYPRRTRFFCYEGLAILYPCAERELTALGEIRDIIHELKA